MAPVGRVVLSCSSSHDTTDRVHKLMTVELQDIYGPASAARPDQPAGAPDFPLGVSVGYQVRMTHRALQRFLQSKIEPHGVTLGMWYFLRVLWVEDGLTQRELSRRVGTMEPTTLAAILQMEKSGFVTRVRGTTDRRRQHIHLTPKGREIGNQLLPLAVEVVQAATAGLSTREIGFFLDLLKTIQANLGARLDPAFASDDAA